MLDNAAPPAPPTPAPGTADVSAPPALTEPTPNMAPIPGATPAAAPPAPAPVPHALPVPPAEFQRQVQDQVQQQLAEQASKHQAELDALRAEFAPKPAAQAATPTYSPVFARDARQALGETADDATIDRYANAAQLHSQWFAAQNSPKYAADAPAALQKYSDVMTNLVRGAEWAAFQAQRAADAKAAEDAANPEASAEASLPATVSECIQQWRTVVTPEWLTEAHPAIGASVAAGHDTVAGLIESAQLTICATPQEAVVQFNAHLAALNRDRAARPAPAQEVAGQPGVGNPAAMAPQNPAAAGHVGQGHASNTDAYHTAIGLTQPN